MTLGLILIAELVVFFNYLFNKRLRNKFSDVISALGLAAALGGIISAVIFFPGDLSLAVALFSIFNLFAYFMIEIPKLKF